MPFLGRKATIAAQGFGLNSSGKVKFSKQEYTTAGTYTFTVPTGNNAILVTASGGGAAGQTSYFDGGSWHQTDTGAAGGNTTVTNGTFTVTARGGNGANTTGGTVTISGATSTTLNQTGGSNSGATGGNSYYASGTAQGGDFSKPADAGKSAGGGGGYQMDGPTNYGGSAGGTGIAVVPVSGGQVITITVGSGGAGINQTYTKGSNHGSYAGNGGVGYVSIEMA
jgi:hypothetical protein